VNQTLRTFSHTVPLNAATIYNPIRVTLTHTPTGDDVHDRIVVIRQNGTTTTRVPFNYRKVANGWEPDNFFVRAGSSPFGRSFFSVLF
jgi:hypothetical protein